jgi:NAD(P)-dependent dehydrogenase (short-subunit alcohol dehydrogenase family)
MKNILVTGASGALGTSLVSLMESFHFKVVTMGKSEKNQIKCDFSSNKELEIAIGYLSKLQLDTAVFCHALPEEGLDFQQLEDSFEYAQRYFKISYLSTLFLVESLTKMNVNSLYIILGAGIGGKPLSNSVLYAPIKASLATLVETIAPRFQSRGVKIFGISPGRIVGGLSTKLLNLPQHKIIPELREDAIQVEKQGTDPTEVARNVLDLMESLESLGMLYTGRLFSAMHDKALVNSSSQINPDHFRLRRKFI